MNEFAKNRGLQFDPNITDILLEALEQGAFDIGRANGFVDDESNAKRDKYDGVDEAGKILTMIMETMHNRPSGDDVDYLTGLPMRGKGEEQIASLMKTSPGALIFFDMDNLKKINDVHGHRAGDKALCCIGKALSAVAGDGVVCRIGGDEFLLFVREKDENLVSDKVREVLELFGKSKDTDVLIKEASLSAGICMCTPGDSYADVLAKADKALYFVKHRGKDGYYFYREDSEHLNGSGSAIDIEKLMSAIRRAGNYSGAMDIEYREFAKMYEYIGNLCERYKHTCHLSLVTMDIKSGENAYIDEIEQAMNALETAIRDNIRNVDVCTRYSSVQYLVILLEAGEQNVDTIMERIFNNFHKLCGSEKFVPQHESRTMMDV